MARQKATQTAREMAGDSSALGSVKRAIAPAARGLGTATRPNRVYRHATILVLVALAASSGTPAGGCLEPRECAPVVGRVPTAEWARVALRTCDAGGAQRHLRASAARHLRTLRRRGEIPAQVVVASGMHGTRRYGRAVPRWLVRARSDRGPARRERHMTAQCVTNGMWVTLDAVRAVPGDSLEVAFSTVHRRVRAVCARAGVRPTLLMDREFFTTGVPGRLGRHRTRWLMPCPNSPRVAAAIRKFMSGGRPAVSTMRISDGRKRESFRHAFRRFERLLNTALPDKKAAVYVDDLRFMAKVLRLLAMYYDPQGFDIRAYGAKVRKIIDEAIVARDIAHLVRGAEIRNENFMEEAIPRIASKATRAALLISRIRSVISDIQTTDPEYADSLRVRLEGIIRRERQRRIESLDELAEIYRDCVDRSSEIRRVFGGYCATPLEFSLYHALEKPLGREAGVRLAKEVFRRVMEQTHIIDWREKVTVRKLMQRDIYEALRREGLGDSEIEGLSESILQKTHAMPDGPDKRGRAAPLFRPGQRHEPAERKDAGNKVCRAKERRDSCDPDRAPEAHMWRGLRSRDGAEGMRRGAARGCQLRAAGFCAQETGQHGACQGG